MSTITAAQVAEINALLEGTTIAPIVMPKSTRASRRNARKSTPVAATPKTVDPTIGSGAAMAAAWDGRMMKSAAGTATSGQIKRLVANGVKPAAAKKLSMVAAADKYAALTGKI